MSVRKLAISLPEWLYNEAIESADNKSARIMELIVHGYMAEKQKLYNASGKSKGSSELAPLRSGRNFLTRVLSVPKTMSYIKHINKFSSERETATA